MTDRMHAAAAELQFEVAARLRDEVGELKKELRQMREAGSPDRPRGIARRRAWDTAGQRPLRVRDAQRA